VEEWTKVKKEKNAPRDEGIGAIKLDFFERDCCSEL
jgi:hypothetical protein